jgi:hypothetical protein
MNEIEKMKDQLEAVNAKLAKLNGGSDAHLDQVQKYFHLGMVGGSGNKQNLSRLNARRERSIDKYIEQAKAHTTLTKERDDLLKRINYIESGRKERAENFKSLMQERVRNAKVGDTVIDSSFGEVKVARVNQKTLTIETASGYREARPYSLIIGVKANVS